MKTKKNKINRILVICLVVLGAAVCSLLASCKKDNGTGNNSNLNLDGICFKASTEGGNRNAKTYLDGQDIKWMEEDLILVQNSANPVQQAPFQVVEGVQTMNGTFYTGSAFDRTPDYNAAYPYDKVTISGNTATFTLPQQQQMTQTGTFGNGAMPMVAHSSTETLNFYNVCGGICFPLQGAGVHVTKLVLTSKDASDKLWGTFTADCTAVPVAGNVTSGPMPTFVPGSAGNNSVELVCNGSTGITLTAEAQDFYIMVPPQTMKSGFTLEIYDGTTLLYNRSIDWDAATHTNFITRSVVSMVQTALTFGDPLTVTTVSPTFISQTQAYGQGTVTGEADNITERGFCWALGSVTTTPTLANSHKAEGGNTAGDFATMFGDSEPMTKDCVYYVRAYAKNASGVPYYGDPIPFATRKDYSNDYNGRMPYAYSVASNRQVNFSSGNLQYRASTNTWRFAEYQFEYVGGTYGYRYGNVYANGEHPDATLNGTASNNNSISSSYDGWIDLFGWATSGYHNNSDSHNTYYRPYDSYYQANPHLDPIYSDNESGYGPSYNMSGFMALTGANANYDWGVNNNISNDGAFGSGEWRTMTCNGTDGEWDYLFKTRNAVTTYPDNTTAVVRFIVAQINARRGDRCNIINGIILFPDAYTWPVEVTNYPSTMNFDGTPVQYANGHQWTEAEWSLLEKNGAVLLPAAGYRNINAGGSVTVNYPLYEGLYHSVTRASGSYTDAYNVFFGSPMEGYFMQHTFLYSIHGQGKSVRLVRNI